MESHITSMDNVGQDNYTKKIWAMHAQILLSVLGSIENPIGEIYIIF